MPEGASPDDSMPSSSPSWRRVSWLSGRYAVCRLDPRSADGHAAGVWLRPKSLGQDELFSLTRSAGEVSVVCSEGRAPDETVGAKVEAGWVVMRLDGPIPFDQVGVLASLAAPLAAARIGIFAVSTFDTDYVLVAAGDASRAQAALEGAGFTFREAASRSGAAS